jgi:hypothetical protein
MWLAALRDAAIVLLALLSIVIGILLALMLLQIRSLIRLLREEIAPMLASANETLSTVQGTTHFVRHNVVRPVVQISSYSAAALQVIRSLLYFRRGPHG